MIRGISIRNFKCLRDVQADLERFTVFVGPNASGKSSILQGVDLLCRTFRDTNTQGLDGVLREAVSRGATTPTELAGESEGKWYRYRVVSQPNPVPHPRTDATTWDGSGCGVGSDNASDLKSWKREPSGLPLSRSVVLRLETSRLVQAPAAAPDPTVMLPDGTGLHAALASMALNDPDSWQDLQTNLRQIIPTIRRLRHTKAVNAQPVSLLFDTIGADSLPASQVSEGTLLVLGMLAALHATGRPNLILLDDLDRGLHPRAQKDLIALLRRLLKSNEELQILATTHSPYLLDCMETNEVRMTVLREDGSTVCSPLPSHPKFEKWKDEMTPGEMWSLFGEKWMVEQGVAS